MRVLSTFAIALSIIAQQVTAGPACIPYPSTTYFESMVHNLESLQKLTNYESDSLHILYIWHSQLPSGEKTGISLSLEDALRTTVDRAYGSCYWNETRPQFYPNQTNYSSLCSDMHTETGQRFATSLELSSWIESVKTGIKIVQERAPLLWMEKSETLIPSPPTPHLHGVPYCPSTKGGAKVEKRDGDVEELKPTPTKGILEQMATNILCVLGITKTLCHD